MLFFCLSPFWVIIIPMRQNKKGIIGGFTLIEMMMVILIISVIVAIAGLSTKARNENLSLSIQHEKLRSLFFRAKTLAMNSVSANGAFCGYGVYIDTASRKATIFIDKQSGGSCASGGSVGRYDVADQLLNTSTDTFVGESGIDLACFYGANWANMDSNFTAGSCATSIVYTPPDPTATFSKGGSVINSDVAIGVYSKRSPQKTKKIILNKYGLIDAVQK